MKKKKDKVYLVATVSIAVACLLSIAFISKCVKATPTEIRPSYVICDVLEQEENEDGSLNLYCLMQNGDDVEIYTITDPPIGKVYEVCLKSYNLDDYTTYEVVAVR